MIVTKADVLRAIDNLSPAEQEYRNAHVKTKYHKPILFKGCKMKTVEKKIETPVKRFQRIAGARVGRAKYALELIGNCNGVNYEYTEQQVDKIETVLLDTVSKTLDALRNPRTASKKDVPKHFVTL